MLIFNSFNIANILLMTFVIVISMILHELAHGWIALKCGDATAKVSGRLTLNPLAHIDIFGFFMLMTVGFGYAKPVPVNPNNFRHRKRGLFAVAIAGIVMNLILAFACSGLWALFAWLQIKFPGAARVLSYFATFFQLMVIINLNFFFFNLLPIYPLDGFRIIESFTRYNNPFVSFFRKYGRYFLLGLVCLSILVDIFCSISAFAEYAYIFQYFDILGMYITYCRSGVIWLFGRFWGIFINFGGVF